MRDRKSSYWPARDRRGAALFGGIMLLAVLAAGFAGLARVAQQAELRHQAEAAAQRIDSLAWHLDTWLHSNPGFTIAATGPARPPRGLSAVETGQVVSPPFAAPWLGQSDAVTTADPPPPSSDWQVRFAVGWPSGGTPSVAGIGPPYGVLVATALTGRARSQVARIREALRRRGAAVPTGAAGLPAAGVAAIGIATAAGLPVDPAGNDVVLLSWRHGRILDGIALRRPRAGHPPPGMNADLQLSRGLVAGRLEVAGDAEFRSVTAPAADLAAGSVVSVDLRSADLEVESGILVGGNVTAASIASERFDSPATAVSSTGASAFRLARVQRDAGAGRASVQAAAVSGTLDVRSLDAGMITGLDLETPGLDLSAGGSSAETRVAQRFYARWLRLTGRIDVSPPGRCHGCINDP